MPVPDNLRCEKCGALLRELREAWEADRRELAASDRDLTELRKEWLSADDFQMAEYFLKHHPRSVAARRRWKEHEILTGHSLLLHGWRTGFLQR